MQKTQLRPCYPLAQLLLPLPLPLTDAEDAVEALLEHVGELGREQRVALLARGCSESE